jgi:hypothetical protein
MLDDLEHRLEQYEARLRAARLLLAQQKHRRAGTPEETLALAAKLFQISGEADALAEQLNHLLRTDSDKRTQELRARQYAALQEQVPVPMWPVTARAAEAKTDPPYFGSEKLFGSDEDEAGGNAPVPAFPKRPVPVLSGSAARRFEESDEPPRSP